MPTVMTKYKFNGKNYLVYTHNILARDFKAKDWSKISNYDEGVGADFIVVFAGNDIAVYNAIGKVVKSTKDTALIIAYHEHKQIPADVNIERSIEVRLTDSFVRNLDYLSDSKAFIA